MKPIHKVKKLYADQPINERFKSVNLLIVSIILLAMTVLMSLVHVVMGRYFNLTSSLPAAAVATIALFLLLRGRFRVAGTLLLFFLALTPFTVMLTQAVTGPRDLFMYFYFALPMLILTVIVGYARWQLWSMAAISVLLAGVYFALRLAPESNATGGDTVSAVVFALLYFVLSVSFLSVSFRVERRILESLEANRRAGEAREARLQALLQSAGSSLSISEDLSSLASSTTTRIGEIDQSSSTIVDGIADLHRGVTASQEERSRVTTSRVSAETEMQKQREAVARSSSAIEEMTAAIRHITTSAEDKQESARLLAAETSRAEETFGDTMEAFAALERSSNTVLDVMTVIEDIAQRTNILAMNAAIEAAHAGDTGRGFAVVAEEIRKLAEETNQNSAQIRSILQQNSTDIAAAVQAGQENSTQFSSIQDRVTEVQQALTEITTGMTEVAEGTQEIVESVQQLRSTNNAVDAAMSDMDAVLASSQEVFDQVDRATESIRRHGEEIARLTTALRQGSQQLQDIGDRNAEGIRDIQRSIDGIEAGVDI